MIDLLLSQTGDGFDITESNGTIALTSGIQTAIIISLAGGNADDDGSDATFSKQFWANYDQPDETKRIRSETLALLNSIPATSGNVGLIADAANRDLAWMLAAGYISDLTSTASIVAPRRVRLVIDTPEGSVSVEAPWLG